MVVFCEECGKKYKVDDSMIVGEKARCKCMSCGHIIEVKKQEAQEPKAPAPGATLLPPESPRAQVTEQPAAPMTPGQDDATTLRSGLSIGVTMLINFLGYAVLQGAILTFLYITYVPTLLLEQVELRTSAISKSLSTAVSQPLLLRNYLLVNKTAETISKLPGVAYVAVLNKKGIVVSGIFGDLQRFSPEFSTKVKETGFPKDVVAQNPITAGSSESAKDFVVGKKKIHDVAQVIEEAGGVVHVGLFAEDVEIAVKRSPKPLLAILASLLVLGALFFLLLARTISTPIKALTEVAHRISLGELDLPIDTSKGGEIGALATSLDRMRFSIKSAMDRLRRR